MFLLQKGSLLVVCAKNLKYKTAAQQKIQYLILIQCALPLLPLSFPFFWFYFWAKTKDTLNVIIPLYLNNSKTKNCEEFL